MPSGWDVYYVLFLSAVMALGIPLSLGLLSLIFTQRSGPQEDQGLSQINGVTPAGKDTELGRRLNTRFFMGANTALLFLTFGLLLVPCVSTLQTGLDREVTVPALIAILSFVAFSALGLLYAVKKGDLDWLRSFSEETAEPSERRVDSPAEGSSQ